MAKKIYNIPEHKTVASTPGTPALGHSKIYPKSDNLWYYLDENGIENILGSGGPSGSSGTSGSSGINGSSGTSGVGSSGSSGTTGAAGSSGTSGTSGTADPVQVTITTSSSFATSDTISGYGQNGKHIMIDNGASNINVTCNGSVTASYQVLGTGTVTFIAGSGRTITIPSGAVINTQYGTATLSHNVTNDIVLINNV